ncbi:MAG: hypothetical protein EOO47_04740 [Flavobacterium sp.]|nr:MAG: hypothetical protein EOO47_04740 [Flavobacterium sp.]
MESPQLAEIKKDMKHLQRTLLSVIIFTPLITFAHGQEALTTFYIATVSIIIFLIVIVAIKVDLKRKLILMGAYLLSFITIFYVTNSWYYRENMNKINLLVTLAPATVFLITFLALKSRLTEKIRTTKE